MAKQLAPAYIKSDEAGIELKCLYNPSEYTFTKNNSWKADPITSSNLPKPSFQGGNPMTMKVQLFFDTYVGEESSMTDVRDHTDKLLKLMAIDSKIQNNDKKAKHGRPPIVLFVWGEMWSFKSVIKSCSLKFTLFTSTGMPVRATADLELQQVMEDGIHRSQNPTSGGEDLRSSRVARPGDTLELIAYQEYGNATDWRVIADANGMEDPRALKPGQRIIIPNI